MAILLRFSGWNLPENVAEGASRVQAARALPLSTSFDIKVGRSRTSRVPNQYEALGEWNKRSGILVIGREAQQIRQHGLENPRSVSNNSSHWRRTRTLTSSKVISTGNPSSSLSIGLSIDTSGAGRRCISDLSSKRTSTSRNRGSKE